MENDRMDAWLDECDLRRARGARLLAYGEYESIISTLEKLAVHGIVTTSHAHYATAPSPDHHQLVVICSCPFREQTIAPMAQACKRSGTPFFVVLPDENPIHRKSALVFGARDTLSVHWSIDEIFARIVRTLAAESTYARLHTLNAAIRRRIAEKRRMLEKTRLEIVHRLGRAAEYRDNETGEHVVRVGKFCEIVARQLGVSAHHAQLLRHASPLHDIGKIGVADSILLKSAPLDRNEWAIMKQHTIIGAQILAGTDDELLGVARVVALTHHERWNGSGYPAGLAGEDIPRDGRIAAVCDVYDALTSERPYKSAWSHEQAMEYVMKNRGIHFDPEVVDAFTTSLREIHAVKQTHCDSTAPANIYKGATQLQLPRFNGVYDLLSYDAGESPTTLFPR